MQAPGTSYSLVHPWARPGVVAQVSGRGAILRGRSVLSLLARPYFSDAEFTENKAGAESIDHNAPPVKWPYTPTTYGEARVLCRLFC
jgi:hypothetical protein